MNVRWDDISHARSVKSRTRPATMPLVGVILAWSLWMVGSGCAHRDKRAYSLDRHPECRERGSELRSSVERSRSGVATWLEDTAWVSAEAALRSYPDADGPLAHKSYLYDNALGLLWFSWTDERERAARLARTLVERQSSDGSWRFHFDLRDSRQSARIVRSGAVAWAGYALARFARRFEREAADRAAREAASFLWENRLEGNDATAGLVSAGYTVEEGRRRPAKFAATEHQFDAHALLALVAPERARRLEEHLRERLWLPEDGRFSMGAQSESLDRRRALDAAGAWGALWLEALGDRSAARRSLRYVIRHFRTEGPELQGYRPYLDASRDYAPDKRRDHIFVEGTLSVGLAALRLDREALARRALRLGAQLQCMSGGGIPYSNLEVKNFAAEPAVAPSLWFLFLEREWRTDEPAPIFHMDSPEETDRTADHATI